MTVTLLAGGVSPSFAHEVGAPFSGAIIDPLALHHAHIENEQRVNFFVLRGMKAPNGGKRNGFESELELGWSNSRFNFGVEALIPFVSRPSPEDSSRVYSIGDIELRPVKYAIVSQPGFVVSVATGLTLPTGDRQEGTSRGSTTLTQYLFIDKAIGNWYAGLNLAADTRFRGERGSGGEYGAVLSYSFIESTGASALAPTRPAQRIVFSPSFEWIRSRRWSGPDAGESITTWLPGLTAWWPNSGWQIRAGISMPRSGPREANRTILFQIGNHLNWDDVF